MRDTGKQVARIYTAKSGIDFHRRQDWGEFFSFNVKQLGGNFQFPSASYQYALYPVWILNTTWRNEKFVFAMNGQTGKLTGDLPLDKKAFRLTLLMRGGIFSIVFIALLWLLF